MKSRLSPLVQHALCVARELTSGTVAGSILPEHLAAAILGTERSVAVRVLQRLGADIDRLVAAVAPRIVRRRAGTGDIDGGSHSSIVELFTLRLLSDRAGRIMDQAYREAISLGDPYLGTEHILLALVGGLEPGLSTLFKRERVTYSGVRQQLESRLVGPAETAS